MEFPATIVLQNLYIFNYNYLLEFNTVFVKNNNIVKCFERVQTWKYYVFKLKL